MVPGSSLDAPLERCAFVYDCKGPNSFIIPLHHDALTRVPGVRLGIKCFLNRTLSRELCKADSRPGARFHTLLCGEWQMVPPE